MVQLILLLSGSVLLVLVFVIIGICRAAKESNPAPYFAAAVLCFAAFTFSLAIFIGTTSRHSAVSPVPVMGPGFSHLGIA